MSTSLDTGGFGAAVILRQIDGDQRYLTEAHPLPVCALGER